MLEALRNRFLAVRISCRQGTYARRFPPAAVAEELRTVQAELVKWIEAQSSDCEAAVLLSEVCECLLEFRSSRAWLEQALLLGLEPSNPIRVRLWKLEESAREWDALGLQPRELADLGAFLRARHSQRQLECTRDRVLTKVWLRQNCPERVERILTGLDERGAYSDWQVLMNVVVG